MKKNYLGILKNRIMHIFNEFVVLFSYLLLMKITFLFMYFHLYYKTKIMNNNNVEITIGMICIVDMQAWGYANVNDSCCPWKSLIGLVRVLKKKRNSQIECEFYDREFGTRDTIKLHKQFLIPLISINDISEDCNLKLNQYLIKEREIDSVEAGSPKDTEGFEFRIPVSQGGIPRDIKKYNKRMDDILSIIINDNILKLLKIK
jgi:hypothetical protein